jgi:hypothetical protein
MVPRFGGRLDLRFVSERVLGDDFASALDLAVAGYWVVDDFVGPKQASRCHVLP